jgi:hypothetical protein
MSAYNEAFNQLVNNLVSRGTTPQSFVAIKTACVADIKGLFNRLNGEIATLKKVIEVKGSEHSHQVERLYALVPSQTLSTPPPQVPQKTAR